MPKNSDGDYGVEWTNNPRFNSVRDLTWDTKVEALAEAQKKYDSHYKFIWVGKWSDSKDDWLYVWWTEETGWGPLPENGYGKRAKRGDVFWVGE